MAEKERSAEYRTAHSKLWNLSDHVLDDVYDIVSDLPADEQKKLIDDFFGSDFYDYFLEWADEE